MKISREIMVFIGILLGMSNSMVMQTILTTSLPEISNEFGTVSYYSWVYSGYMLASTVTIPMLGRICDKFGYRKNYVIGGALFFLGTLGSGICIGMKTLVLSRIIMGIGSGIIVPATYGILGIIFKKEKMTKVFGFIAVFQIICNGFGSFIGGIFTTYLSWRYGMFILIPIEIIGFIIIYVNLDDTKIMKNNDVLDIKSGSYFTISLVFILYGLEKCSKSFYNINVLFIILGLVLLSIFIFFDWKKENGILPEEIKTSGLLKGLLLEVMFIGGVLNICLAYLPAYMVKELNLESDVSGKLLLVYIITMGAGSIISSYIKLENRKQITFGWISILLGGILGIVSFAINPLIFFTISTFFLGLGVGILNATIMGSMQMKIDKNRATANGIAHLMRNFGGTLGVSALQICLVQEMKFLFIAISVIGVVSFTTQIVTNKYFIREQ